MTEKARKVNGVPTFTLTTVKPNGEVTVVPHQRRGGVELDTLQAAVEGYIEFVPLLAAYQPAGFLEAWVNEEGRLRSLAPNPQASVMCGQPIVGNLAIVSRAA